MVYSHKGLSFRQKKELSTDSYYIDELWKHRIWKKSDTKATWYMISCMWNVWTRQIIESRLGAALGWGKGEWRIIVSVQGEESVPELGNGDGCIICDYTKKIIKFFFFFLKWWLGQECSYERHEEQSNTGCILHWKLIGFAEWVYVKLENKKSQGCASKILDPSS